MKSSKLAWYWNRLCAMETQEIIAHSELAVRKMGWRRRNNWQAPAPIFHNNFAWSPICPINDVGNEKIMLLFEAQKYLDHNFQLLNVEFKDEKIDWHFDPETRVRSPVSFGLDINYRDRGIAGNIKNIWELNRHQHLTLLSVAYALTGEDKYAVEVSQQLEIWLESNPFPMGVNWHSSLEAGTRLVSWIWIDRMLTGSASHEKLFGKNGILWQSIYWHQWFIYHHRSYGSSSNNHLVGEVVGLFMASTVWPYFDESARWKTIARKHLETEVGRQTFPSGLNREQAFRYHLYSSELFLLATFEAKRYHEPLSDKYDMWTKKMIEVIPKLIDVGGNLPAFGDEDGGRAIHLRPLASSRLEWLYWLGAHLTDAYVPSFDGDMSLLAATMGLPKEIPECSETFNLHQGSFAIEDAGLYAMARNRGTVKEIFSLVDAGPLGFLNIAAHGHADALSFTMAIGGVPIIIDVGTYSYFRGQHERDYFRSTRAHNTITVDNTDQSISGGPFLWRKKANVTVINWRDGTDGVELIGEHDGYTRLESKVVHLRKFFLTDRELTVDDYLKGTGEHRLEWCLHFHPDCGVSFEEGTCNVVWQSGSLEIELDDAMQWKLLYGEGEGGWYSPKFNLKIPTTTLVGSLQIKLPKKLRNTIKIHHAN